MITTLLLALLLMRQSPQIHLEAEDGKLVGVTVAHERAGYSGTGYVTGFHNEGDHVELHFSAQAGLYDVRIRFSSPSGGKGFDLAVNGARYSGMFPQTGDFFAVQNAGKVELHDGVNALEIDKGWGWFDIDSVDLVPSAPSPMPQHPPATPADPNATSRTRALLRYLISQYGHKTLSGQYELNECSYIASVTGRDPAILGSDFMDYSPSRVAHGSKPKDGTESVIRQAVADGQIVTMSWHWNAPTDLIDATYKNERGETVEAPWYKGFYTYATHFDLAKALADPHSENYALLLRDIDTIAAELKKFADADIPVLWRPLHEAEGGWFWWGAKGPEAYKQLYRLMFDRLTHLHQLHNLLWVENSLRPEWYPGDAYVDIVAADSYPSDPSDPLGALWDSLQERFNGKKLLAIAEFGGVPDVAKMHRFGARWAYFVSWTGGLGPHKVSVETLKRIYQSPDILTRPSSH